MKPLIDLKGKKFGRWAIIERGENSPQGRARWRCKCECGNESQIVGHKLTSGSSKSCGCFQADGALKRSGKLHPGWQGGKYKSFHGYILKLSGESRNRRYRPEHVLVMEEFLGRKLDKKETVHHKNGIRDDNRIENLELWASKHCPGQRVEDLVSWSIEILKQYKPEILK